jgi:pyruvate dehydrogenase E2 component (dihydrolipoamide acetyltransferase)
MTAPTELDGVQTKLTGIRRTAARRLVGAWAAPAFHLVVEVDMSSSLARKSEVEGATVTDLLLLGCARALRDNPSLNAHYADEIVTTFSVVNLGVAVATDAGLMVPVIHGADTLGVAGIVAARKDIIRRARQGALGMADVTGGTFTVSNLGMMGVSRFDAVLNPPQVGILAVGATNQRWVWNGGEPAWRPIAELSLTCDHRAIDGATGARFLGSLRSHLEGTDGAGAVDTG